MSFIVHHLAFIHSSILEYENAIAIALVICDFANVHFMLSNSGDFNSMQVLFHLIGKLFIKRFVELSKELLNFEFR